MAVLPEEIPTGLVTGQFYFVNEDNADANTDPELTVVSGKVTFTCEAKAPLRMPTKKAVVIPLVFDAEFDSQGRLVPAGRTEVGIELPASDSALFNPTGFTWRVRFDLVDTATGFTVNIDPFSISVPEGVTSDLVDLMPVSTEPGTIMVQGPQGEQGIQGIQGPQGDGVPAGGTALQILRRNSEATGSEWVTPTKSIVGLDNVDNTSDLNKPVSTAQQEALNAKENTITAGTTAQYWRGDKTWQTLDKAAAGLGSVDNTSDANKPVSTATQAALNAKANDDGLLKGTLGRKFRLIAGTIRNDGTGWKVIDDTGHRPTGVTGVTATATSIDIAFAATAKVVSFICGPDEVYAARGLRMGASVALDVAKVLCYQDNEHRISDYVTWDGTAWTSLNGVFSGITFDEAGKIAMTHEDVGTAPLSGAVSARPPAGAAANTVAFLGGMTATTTNVEVRTPAGAVIVSLANPTRLWVERAGKRKTTKAVDPATLTEASGNIWFIGVVED